MTFGSLAGAPSTARAFYFCLAWAGLMLGIGSALYFVGYVYLVLRDLPGPLAPGEYEAIRNDLILLALSRVLTVSIPQFAAGVLFLRYLRTKK